MSKVVLITGASSGFGRSIAEKLSNHDFIVYGTSRNPKEIEGKYKLLKLDITEYQDAERITDYLIDKHGKIDILINNAGISITGPVESSDMSEIKRRYKSKKNWSLRCWKYKCFSRKIKYEITYRDTPFASMCI